MKARLITRFKDYSEGDFLTKVDAIFSALSSEEGLALFPEPWGDPVRDPTRAKLGDAVRRHEELYTAALNGGKPEIIARRKSRADLTEMLRSLAMILERIARHDAGMLSKTGYDLRKTPSAPVTGTLPGPEELRLARGVSGTLIVSVKKLKGARSYEVSICDGDPNVEANWRHAITAGTCRGIEIAGLTPGTMYHVRVRGIGSKGPGGWSNIEQMMPV